ncbi:MAG: terminase family protein [Candidatus Thiodiazotropha endolucinida]|nr:terminase family protein [Candidatus Thiodiazotropha taylori]MCW4324065.1 terminase family protein [Candidatus Thiodiazotropha taylori]
MIELSLQEKQTVAFTTEANEVLFGGAAGGGKSHLLRVLALFFAFEIPGVQIYLFRRMVDDLEKNHLYGPGGFLNLLSDFIERKKCKYNAQKKTFFFENKSQIFLCYLKNNKDLMRYQGAEIHILLIDELTHFLENQYRYLRGRTRLGGLIVPDKFIPREEGPPLPFKAKLPLVVGASNPGSIGHNWVKRTFVKFAPPQKVVQTSDDEGGRKRTFIPSLLKDNQILEKNDPDYRKRLAGLGDPALVKAMLEGDWDIVSGGAFDDVWSYDLIIEPFPIPASWRIDRSLDWGSSRPFSVGWWALTDGTEVELPTGRTFCPPAKSLIRIHEWYGAKKNVSNTGLRLPSSQVAEGIKERERRLKKLKIISGKIFPGPADNSIRDTGDEETPSVEDVMKRYGVKWSKSNKKPGSRIVGLELLRQRMIETKKPYPELPAIYFFNTCLHTIEILPGLPRDETNPEDVDTDSEDHIYDEIRYRVLATANEATSIRLRTTC